MRQRQERHNIVRAQSDPAEVADMHAESKRADCDGRIFSEMSVVRRPLCHSTARYAFREKIGRPLGTLLYKCSSYESACHIRARKDRREGAQYHRDDSYQGTPRVFFTLRPCRDQRRSQGGRMTDHICSLRAPQILRLRLWRDLPSLAAST